MFRRIARPFRLFSTEVKKVKGRPEYVVDKGKLRHAVPYYQSLETNVKGAPAP